MADVKWIKILTDIFDDEKILLIESLPDSDSIIVIWFKLLCLAGKQNNRGVFMVNDKINYTDEMLAIVLKRPLATVQIALETLQNLGMIKIEDGIISLPNWNRNSFFENKQSLRFTPEYKKWRESIFERDNYTCRQCGKHGGKLNAHHIMPFALFPQLRFAIDNGISLCEDCHKRLHQSERHKEGE